MNKLLCLFSITFLLALNGVTSLPKNEQRIILRGRVTFPDGPRIPIETDGVLTVEIQDASLADAPAKVIAKGIGQAIRFPMAFAVKYTPDQVMNGGRYSLRVNIRNKNNELLYTNDMHIGVTLTGPERTKFIDVPVILVKKPAKKYEKRQWFELVGRDGKEAVEIIKKETGFTNVMTVHEGSPMTMDYRTDRVRVVVNDKGLVSRVPNVA